MLAPLPARFITESRAQTRFNYLLNRVVDMFQEEDAVLAEMEFTGQAFEEMQEQNVRLLQQLREKDEANLKLMSEVQFGLSKHFCFSFLVFFFELGNWTAMILGWALGHILR